MASTSSASRSQVLSMGEVLVDFIVTDGATSLESAEAFVARAGGAPANAAVALARFGIPAAFCGVTGADPFGARLAAELAAQGVDISRLRQSHEAKTTLAFAWKDSRGDGHFWLLRGADTLLGAEDVEQAGIPELAALVVGTVSMAAQPSRGAIERAVRLAREAAAPIVLDVNLRPTLWPDLGEAKIAAELVASQSTIVKLSLDDAIGLYGSGIGPEAAIARMLALGPRAVVLTDGDRGCWFSLETDQGCEYVPAFAVEAIEPTGAGDAFTAALIARLLASEWSPLAIDDIRYAAAAGALATTKRGAWEGLPTRQQLASFLATA